MGIEPSLATGFQVGKVHNSADGILRIPGYKKVGYVIVTVEVFAFSAMLVQTMARTEFDAAHDR